MKKIMILMCALAIIIGIPATAEKIKVGLLPFSGNAKAEYRALADNALSSMLFRLGRFDVEVYSGWNTALPYATFLEDDEDVALLGRQMQVEIMIAGQVENLYANLVKGSDGKQYYRAEARVSLLIVAVHTGLVLDTITSTASANDSRRSEVAMNNALRKCFDDDMEVRLRELFALSSTASQVAGRTVQFGLGGDAGVRVGTRFNIFREQNVTGDGATFSLIPVGMIETTSVTDTSATARLLWANDAVLLGDRLQEETRPHKRNLGTGLTLLTYSVQDQTGNAYTGIASAWRGYSGEERPFCCSWGVMLESPGMIRSVFLAEVSSYFGFEKELVPGRWYSAGRLAVGATLGAQDYSAPCAWCSPGTATGATFFIAGDGGLKYYLTHQEGLRLDVGAGFQLGPPISKWVYTDKAKNEYNYTAYVQYPVVSLSGLRLHVGVGVAF